MRYTLPIFNNFLNKKQMYQIGNLIDHKCDYLI